MTGEGQVDATSFEGKVVGSVVDLAAAADRRVLVIGGRVAHDARSTLDEHQVEWVDLVEVFGDAAARSETSRCVTQVISDRLSR